MTTKDLDSDEKRVFSECRRNLGRFMYFIFFVSVLPGVKAETR
jgi:hypothetical protein